jgi:hypothetical protein
VTLKNGTNQWWLQGKQVNEEDVMRQQPVLKTITIDGVAYTLTPV